MLKFFKNLFKKPKNKLITISLPELEKGRKIIGKITIVDFELTNENMSVTFSGSGGGWGGSGGGGVGRCTYSTEKQNVQGK